MDEFTEAALELQIQSLVYQKGVRVARRPDGPGPSWAYLYPRGQSFPEGITTLAYLKYAKVIAFFAPKGFNANFPVS
jgi:hypothetical protein